MVFRIISDYYHLLLRRPYKLQVVKDSGGNKPVILLLHGLASDSDTWTRLYPLISDSHRVISLDLLGFGKSPKPIRQKYDLSCHANNVINTLKSLKISQDITIVGHSMGGLIAIQIAKQKPQLVSKIITVGMPLYNKDDIKSKSKFKITATTNSLFRIYTYLINNKHSTLKRAKKVMAVNLKQNSFKLNENNWVPFKKSMQNSIMNQSSITDIKHLKIPMVFLYGNMDLLIVSKHYKEFSNPNVTIIRYTGAHLVTLSVAKIIADFIKN
ncbi:MAG: alpha/beta hydrolase [Patescibacteria group bacterium]|jgi:pimeloyl-ACP methyl ester carboxylesterase|nr:alpha/beta hydrolase [Patescibacteria group bacterium]